MFLWDVTAAAAAGRRSPPASAARAQRRTVRSGEGRAAHLQVPELLQNGGVLLLEDAQLLFEDAEFFSNARDLPFEERHREIERLLLWSKHLGGEDLHDQLHAAQCFIRTCALIFDLHDAAAEPEDGQAARVLRR